MHVMERKELTHPIFRLAFSILLLCSMAGIAFAAGMFWGAYARAETEDTGQARKNVRVIYPKKSEIDLDAMKLEGEVKNPADFYFQHRREEKFDSLVKRRKNFHPEMMRDIILSK